MALNFDVRGPLAGFDFDVQLRIDAEPVALVGPSGAGKTTLLLALLGLRTPLAGHVALGERVLFDALAGIDVAPEQRQLGYVPQHHGLFPHLDVLDNVAFGLACGAQPLGKLARRARAREVLQQLTLLHLAARWPRDISGGEAQRVALARAVAVEPAALLLDEPLAALDAMTRQEVRQWLQQALQTLQIPTLLVTHDAGDARALAPRVVVLERGRVMQQGSVEALATHPATPFVAAWTGVPGYTG